MKTVIFFFLFVFLLVGCGSDEADNETVKKYHIVDKENGKKIDIPPSLAELLGPEVLGSEVELIETEETVKKGVDEQVLLVIEEAKPRVDDVYKYCTQADIENWRKNKDKPNILFDGKDYRTGETGKRVSNFDCALSIVDKFQTPMRRFCHKKENKAGCEKIVANPDMFSGDTKIVDLFVDLFK